MKKTIILILIPISTCLQAQQIKGIIYPKTTFSNQSQDTLVYFPKQKLEILMDQEQLNKELISAFEIRIEICDSALRLKSSEAENFYTKLLETDTQLKNLEIANVKKKGWYRRRARIWLGTGVVLGVLACVVL
jgi:hypothetical protein